MKRRSILLVHAVADGKPDLLHKPKHKPDVVDRCQAVREKLVGFEEMVDVPCRERLAGVTVAIFLDWCLLVTKARRIDVDTSISNEERPVARDSGRQDAVEHIYPSRNTLDKVLRRADSHEVPGPLGWEELAS